MNEPAPAVEGLTEDELEAVTDAFWEGQQNADPEGFLKPAVERIVAERVCEVRRENLTDSPDFRAAVSQAVAAAKGEQQEVIDRGIDAAHRIGQQVGAATERERIALAIEAIPVLDAEQKRRDAEMMRTRAAALARNAQ